MILAGGDLVLYERGPREIGFVHLSEALDPGCRPPPQFFCHQAQSPIALWLKIISVAPQDGRGRVLCKNEWPVNAYS